MNVDNMSFNDLYNEMVKRGILPNGRSYAKKERDMNEPEKRNSGNQ